jgi:hypothetical protein
MKKITTSELIKEELGVPNNLIKVSEDSFSRILNWVKRLSEDDFQGGEGVNMIFRVDYNIADYRFTTLKVKLGVDEHPKVLEPEILSMAVRSQSKKTDDYKLEPVKLKTVDLVIVVVVPEGFDYDELPSFFEENKNEIITDLAHEFKHVYDHYKKKYDYADERAKYQAVIGVGFNMDALDKFVHDIYFSSANENLVRPSEIAAAIKRGDISQSRFLDFLRSNNTYINLKRIADFDIENFKKEILKDTKNLNKLLRKVKMKPSEMSDDEKIETVFKILFSTIASSTIGNFHEILKTSIFEELLGFQGEKQKVFEKFIKRVSRFENNPEEFVKSYGKYFNFIGDKMIKKISKLYAITRK